ncbi:hypothetical protein JY96_21315 [Aquabacterium sp. NJ1]|uniref:hypothetical protein n=1 Tax=Aquabacterium sp. NJ1 TaxID=1538295 RepID=UPI00052D7C5D|nr:hypothetical protein [Aquabacterium sp. NJ1]KGM38715.1 hypothetical protein JY96_21315 [Aquabacterium sp. NJ1]
MTKDSKKPPANTSTNARLRTLVEGSGLSQSKALEAFNEGQLRPISLSAFKAWLADPESMRWRPLDPAYLKHAEKVFGHKGT